VILIQNKFAETCICGPLNLFFWTICGKSSDIAVHDPHWLLYSISSSRMSSSSCGKGSWHVDDNGRSGVRMNDVWELLDECSYWGEGIGFHSLWLGQLGLEMRVLRTSNRNNRFRLWKPGSEEGISQRLTDSKTWLVQGLFSNIRGRVSWFYEDVSEVFRRNGDDISMTGWQFLVLSELNSIRAI
jgi:hypothetical protein